MKTKKTCLGRWIRPTLAAGLAGLGLSAADARAQACETYTVASTTTTYVAASNNIGSACDDCVTAVSFPFSVNVYGTPQSSAIISSNGNIQFTGGGSAAYTNGCLPSGTFVGYPVFLPHWDDQRTDGANNGIFTETLGTSPNQRFVIEWRTVYFATPTIALNYEVIFYEGQNHFDVVYGTIPNTGVSATAGVQFNNTGPTTQYSCDTAGGIASGAALRYTCAGLTPGACCATDGTCSAVVQTACAAPSAFRVGACTPNPCPQPPTNDDCATAAAITLPYSYTGFAGGTEDLDVSCNDAAAVSTQNGVWFTYTPATDQLLRIAETSPVNTVIAVFSGGCNSLSEVRCSDPELIVQSLTGGTTYHILVGAYGAASLAPGTSIALTITQVLPPANDTCSNAIQVTGSPFLDASDISTATGDVDVSCNDPAATETRHGVWYRMTTGADPGRITLNETSTSDVVMGIFTGGCDGLSEVYCSDAEAPAPAFLAAANTTYHILVGVWSATTTPTLPLNLTVTFVPEVGSCCVGGNCTITTLSSCTGTWGGPGSNCGGTSGYNFTAGTAAFEDISTTGTLAAIASACDDCGETVALGFTFSFLGTSYTSAWVTSNGFIQFGSPNQSFFTNVPIPTAATPNNMIAPMWDDLNPGVTGDVYYRTAGTPGSQTFTVSWQNVTQYNLTTDESFQVILTEGSNAVEFRYGTITAETPAGDYTVGYESADGLSGGSVPGASLGSGGLSLSLSNANPCSGGGGNGACCQGANCALLAQAACTGANTTFSGAGTVCNTFGVNNNSPCCKGDFNHIGGVTVQDIFDFLIAYFAQNPQADVNGIGGVSVQDIFDYLLLYFAGNC